MKKNKVAILMSTYNGEKYIIEQLESLINQKNILIDIYIRDDCSTDKTIDIIKKYIAKTKSTNIILYEGKKNVGYAYSFWNLIKKISTTYDYYAFCDQDDIWKEEKIYKAIEYIEKKSNDEACIYTSRVISINNEKRVLSENTFMTNGVLNKYECFQKSIVPGCTFVFNKKSLIILKKYKGYMESHDWAAYCIISTFGRIIYDDNSYINYRIHGDNTIGINNKLQTLKIRLKRLLKKSKCARSKFAKDFYETYAEKINDNVHKESIEELAYYKENISMKLKLLFNRNYKGIIFKIYVLLNRV